jgi:hypothetical protein
MIGNDFDTPIMYQDLGNYTMNPMTMPFGGMTSSSYLGGVQMPRRLDHDKLELINHKNKEGNSTFKKAMLGIGACLLLGYIPVLRKGITKAGGIGNYLKNLFKSTPKPTPTPKTSLWAKTKTWFQNAFTKMKGKPHKWARFKAWNSRNWQAFKNLFTKKP